MAITDKTGINVASGFKLVAPVPIDARFIATDETDLQSFITNNAAYKGLTVWVDSLGKSMVYNGTEFVPVASGGASEGSIDTEHIADGAVTTDKLSEDVQDTLDQIGNIDEVLDEINGGGTTSGGSSGSSSSNIVEMPSSIMNNLSNPGTYDLSEEELEWLNNIPLETTILRGKVNGVVSLNVNVSMIYNSFEIAGMKLICGYLTLGGQFSIAFAYDSENTKYVMIVESYSLS